MSWSHPENCADGETCLHTDLRRGGLLAVLVPELENLDLSTLRRNEHALAFDSRHRADGALDLRKSPMGVFASIEQLQLPALERGPRGRCRVAAADQVVDQVDVVVPIAPGLGRATPSLIARLGLVLRAVGGPAAHHEVCGILQSSDPHGKQAIEVDTPERVVRIDWRVPLKDDRTLIEAVALPKYREAGARVAADDRPIDGAWPTVPRQK